MLLPQVGEKEVRRTPETPTVDIHSFCHCGSPCSSLVMIPAARAVPESTPLSSSGEGARTALPPPRTRAIIHSHPYTTVHMPWTPSLQPFHMCLCFGPKCHCLYACVPNPLPRQILLPMTSTHEGKREQEEPRRFHHQGSRQLSLLSQTPTALAPEGPHGLVNTDRSWQSHKRLHALLGAEEDAVSHQSQSHCPSTRQYPWTNA